MKQGIAVPPSTPRSERVADGSRRWQFRPDVEGLRAIAILLVVAYHAGWPFARSGFLGVDVFFVLSGFLISGILLDEVRATGGISLMNFWARRARRLLPAAFIITIVCVGLGMVLLSPPALIRLAQTALAFTAYSANLLFQLRQADYFADGTETDPLLHTWSLSVEEQFYFVFAPLVLLLAVRSAPQGYETFRRRFNGASVVIGLASFAACLLIYRVDPVLVFYSLPTRAWEFAVGALLAGAVLRWPSPAPAMQNVIGLLAIAGVIGSAAIVPLGMAHPGAITLLPVLCTGMLIVNGGGTHSLVTRALGWAPMRFIGRLSYSWYLWHWPLLVFLHELVPTASLELRSAVAFGSLLPAAATYYLVEAPVRHSRRLAGFPRASVAAAVAMAVVVIGALFVIMRSTQVTFATEPRYAAVREAKERLGIYENGCHLSAKAVQPRVDGCVAGRPEADTTVVLVGDSHAAHWFPALEAIAGRRGWRVVSLTKAGCPLVDVESFRNDGGAYPQCVEWRRRVLDLVNEQRPTLLVVSHAYDRTLGLAGTRAALSSATGLAEWQRGIERLLPRLHGRVVFLGDTPRPGFDVPECVARRPEAPERCSYDPRADQRGRIVAAERAAVGTRAHFADLGPAICGSELGNGLCPGVRDGVILFRDTNHLSARFARMLSVPLESVLDTALRSSL